MICKSYFHALSLQHHVIGIIIALVLQRRKAIRSHEYHVEEFGLYLPFVSSPHSWCSHKNDVVDIDLLIEKYGQNILWSLIGFPKGEEEEE